MKWPEYITKEKLDHFISEAIREDIGDGDYSTLASIPSDTYQQAQLIVKEDCILAGIDLASEIFRYYDKELKMEVRMPDGAPARVGDIAFTVSGNARSILTMERLALNCMQRMSGIASNAHEAAQLISKTKTKILDTRKTTPNFRICEKWAVYIGGGVNHRYGLFDMIMLKDNHVDYAGSITKAVESTVAYLKNNNLSLKIEVETRNIEEVKEALSTNGIDIIMLDNMSIETMTEAVKLIDGKVKTEASGNITTKTIVDVAQTGVDYISSGAIIYDAHTKDMSLKAF